VWLHLNLNFSGHSSWLKKTLPKLSLTIVGLAIIVSFNSVNASQNELGPNITIPESSGKNCVLPEEQMRRQHPDLLKHDRIQTLREGIRAKDDSGIALDGSLKQCINCHAIKDDNNKFVRIDNDQHFCASCHKYAAVSIDCFQCHRDIPEGSDDFHVLTNHKDKNYTKLLPNDFSLNHKDIANIAPEVHSDDN
jgi:hypothetical protein